MREDKAHRPRCNLDKQQPSPVPGHPVSFRLYVFHFRGISNQTVTRSVKPVDIKLSYFNRYTRQMRLNKLDGIISDAQVALWRILFDFVVRCRNCYFTPSKIQ